MMEPGFVDTVRLLLEVLPSVFAGKNLALKGGTAINLYLDEMPRLSVDIDAVFIPLGLTRDEATQVIGHEITRIRIAASRAGLGTRRSASSDSDESQLFVYSKKSQVKIEINDHRTRFLAVQSKQLMSGLGPRLSAWFATMFRANLYSPACSLNFVSTFYEGAVLPIESSSNCFLVALPIGH